MQPDYEWKSANGESPPEDLRRLMNHRSDAAGFRNFPPAETVVRLQTRPWVDLGLELNLQISFVESARLTGSADRIAQALARAVQAYELGLEFIQTLRRLIPDLPPIPELQGFTPITALLSLKDWCDRADNGRGQATSEELRSPLARALKYNMARLNALAIDPFPIPGSTTHNPAAAHNSDPPAAPSQSQSSQESLIERNLLANSFELGAGPWREVAPKGKPLRGWSPILKFLGGDDTRPAQVQLKRQNDAEDGPICMVRGRPEVHAEQLKAWLDDIKRRARVGEENRSSKAGAISELSEREAARLPDYKFHAEQRPNARGKARPASDALS